MLHLQYLPLLAAHPSKQSEAGFVAMITLARPEKANALTRDMANEMRRFIKDNHKIKHIKAIVIRGAGNHFCSGIDLLWMKESCDLSDDDKDHVAFVFSALLKDLRSNMIPTICLIQGASVGGALGILAACDSVICHRSSTFMLKEIHHGIAPWLILPYLAQAMPMRVLNRLCRSGIRMSADDALQYGLCHMIYDDHPERVLTDEINGWLMAEPAVSHELQNAINHMDHLGVKNWHMGKATSSLPLETPENRLKRTLKTKNAKLGLTSFLNKKKTPWPLRLAEKITFPDLDTL
ncbi:MAG: enoyl-CoA hydratase/isomerase family protein [Proteobacteria bacterium]|nr:enoyl-CoA hydratase/isomerase family protein [Pseudomonadota bacterium]